MIRFLLYLPIIGVCLYLLTKVFDVTFFDWMDFDDTEYEYIIDDDGNYIRNPNYRGR